jgi:hypothetical protein
LPRNRARARAACGQSRTQKNQTMKKTYLILALFSLAFLFPPCDYVIGPTRAEPWDTRISEGFIFIGEVTGKYQIRYQQWLIELGFIAVVGYFLRGKIEK